MHKVTRFAALAVCAFLVAAPSARAEEASQRFEIEAQELASALLQVSQQSSVVLVAPAQLVQHKQAPAVHGEMTLTAALEKLLEGSGLGFTRGADGQIMVVPKPAPTGDGRAARATESSIRLAQADEGAADTAGMPQPEQPQGGDETQPELEEVVVTGSHIRNSTTASPLIVVDRDDIDRSGYGTVHQVLQNLPQNFGGDQSEGNIGQGPQNPGNGAGVNLRGLGSGSTLVLLNGRRLSYSSEADFVDVSLIPLSAVERVEVLTDGASALYGSDAIGGVVNIILRKDFSGAETQLRYGFTS